MNRVSIYSLALSAIRKFPTTTPTIGAATFTVLLAVVGCSDVAVPDDALVICNDDDTCPDDLVCEPTSRLCVRSLVGDELAAPTATISPTLVGGPFVEAGNAITVDVSFASDPLRDPTIDLVIDGEVFAAFDVSSAGDRTWQATLTASSALPEGRHQVLVSAFDARGLPRRFSVGFVDVDLTPPIIGNVAFSRLPDPRLTPVAFDILDENAIGPAIDVTVAFSVNEDLSETEAPSARFDGVSLPLVLDTAVENPVTFAVAWPLDPVTDGSLDGTFDIVARVVDLAGNVTESVLVPAVEIDATPPLSPPVLVPGAVIFERAPWGRADAAGLDVYTVVGAADVDGVTIVDEGDFVLISRDVEGLREIGRTRADSTGFGGIERGFQLATGDLRDVFIAVADAAGNTSTPVAIQESRWIASPGGKVVGDAISNPHTFEELPILATQLVQGGIFERGAVDGIDARDADALTTEGAGTFTELASDDGDALRPVAGLLVGSAVGHDPVRGFTVIFGGSQSDNIPEGPFAGSDTGCTSAVDDLWVRRADGRFRRLTLPVTAAKPPAMATARFTFDTRTNTLLLVGQPAIGRSLAPPEMWRFDGSAFTKLCTDSVCEASIPSSLSSMGLVNDPVRQVIVAHGGGLGAATFEFDGAGWVPVCGGDVEDCTAPAAGPGGLVYDDTNNRVIWYDGAALSAWDGSTWTALCTDDACLASAPPARLNTTAVWDRRHQTLVTFGGDVAGGSICDHGSQHFPRDGVPDDAARATPPTADTWAFDGTTWTEQITATQPPSRALHQMVWDDTTGTVLVVGGDDCTCAQDVRDPGFRDEIEQNAFAFDGTDWSRVDVAPPAPANFTRRATPPATSFHTMAPSTATGGVVALGGGIGETLVLMKGGRFFNAAVPSGGPTFVSQVASSIGGDVFALESNGGPFAEHLVGQQFVPICEGNPTCGVGGATPTSFGYALGHTGTRVVAFGGARTLDLNFGSTFSATALAETFTFSATEGMVRRCDNGSCGATPARRTRARMASTRNDGEVLLFGGMPGDNETWIFRDDLTWTAAPTIEQPARRQDAVLVFDPTRSATMMTAGTDDEPSTDTRGALPEYTLPASLDIVWEWSDEWHQARVVDPEGDGRPSPRFGAAAAADPEGGIVIQGGTPSPVRLPGGPGQNRALADIWSWDGGANRTPAQRFRVTTSAAGLRAGEIVTGATVRWFGVVNTDGAPTLMLWDGVGYRVLPSTSCGDGCVEAVTDGALTRRSMVGPSRELVVVARGPENGAAPGYSTVETDFVEVSLSTRRGED